MKNIEKFNVELMNDDELVLTEGGQCDCSGSGAGFAKSVKAFFSSVYDAIKKTPPTSPFYCGKL